MNRFKIMIWIIIMNFNNIINENNNINIDDNPSNKKYDNNENVKGDEFE